MKYLFVSYEIALKLKDKGFDEPCLAWYNETGYFLWKFMDSDESVNTRDLYEHVVSVKHTLAPTYQQVQDWFREKHIIIEIGFDTISYGYRIFNPFKTNNYFTEWNYKLFGYYDAYDAAIEEAIKLI